MNGLVQFLQEDNGNFSSTRFVYLIWMIAILSVWVVCSIKAATLVAFPESVLVGLGILQTGKTASKLGEVKTGQQ